MLGRERRSMAKVFNILSSVATQTPSKMILVVLEIRVNHWLEMVLVRSLLFILLLWPAISVWNLLRTAHCGDARGISP